MEPVFYIFFPAFAIAPGDFFSPESLVAIVQDDGRRKVNLEIETFLSLASRHDAHFCTHFRDPNAFRMRLGGGKK